MQTKSNLICIPYAGGSKYSFKDLKPFLNPSIEMTTLELPGRGKRIFAPLLNDVHSIVDDIYQQIMPLLTRNYMLYAHSMGGLLGSMLIRKIQREQQRLPVQFLVTGCSCPKYRNRPGELVLHKLDDAGLKAELQKLGGFPEEILASDELMDFFLPILRADIQALETYVHEEQAKYSVPIKVIAGDNEKIDDEQLFGWELETSGTFEATRMSGNHFFILDHFDKIADIINERLAIVQFQ